MPRGCLSFRRYRCTSPNKYFEATNPFLGPFCKILPPYFKVYWRSIPWSTCGYLGGNSFATCLAKSTETLVCVLAIITESQGRHYKMACWGNSDRDTRGRFNRVSILPRTMSVLPHFFIIRGKNDHHKPYVKVIITVLIKVIMLRLDISG